jgi:hypothetical protein
MKTLLVQLMFTALFYCTSNIHAMQENQNELGKSTTIPLSSFTFFTDPRLSHDTRTHIFRYSDFFHKQLKRHRSDKYFCEESLPCKSDCFIHRMEQGQRMDDITDTLQLALKYPQSRDATKYIVWYELGRIRKNPWRVMSMQTPDDWKQVLFAHEYITAPHHQREKANESLFFEHITTTLAQYKAPPRSHVQYIALTTKLNKTTHTAWNDFILLLEPTLSIITEPKEKCESRATHLTDGGKTLVQHSSLGWSSGYTLPGGEKSWHVQGLPPDRGTIIARSDSSFPLIRAGQGGISLIASPTSQIENVYNSATSQVTLSSDHNRVWALTEKEDKIIFFDLQAKFNKEFHIAHLLNDSYNSKLDRLDIHAHPSEPSTLFIKISPINTRKKPQRQTEWKTFKVTYEHTNKVKLESIESNNDTAQRKVLQSKSINDWNQRRNQFVPTPHAVWRAKQPREWCEYNTLFFAHRPASEFYYIDVDWVTLCDERYNAVIGMNKDKLNLYHTLPYKLSPAERLIIEATRSYSNQINNSADAVQFFGNTVISNQAQQLCTTLQRSSDDPEHIALISKIIRDNVVIPSKCESLQRLVRNYAGTVSGSCVSATLMASYAYLPMQGHGLIKYCVAPLLTLAAAGGIGYGIYKLLENTKVRKRYIDFSDNLNQKIPYFSAEE